MKLKIEKFWDPKTREIVEDINDCFRRLEIDPIFKYLDELFDKIAQIRDIMDPQIRVSLLFIIEKIAQFDPFFDKIVNFLIALLDKEENAHVKEFAVYILGNLVLNKPNLALITRTLPIFVKFCKDSSEYVRTCATDIKNRLDKVKETKIKESRIIEDLREKLKKFINEKLADIEARSSALSKEALNLDYESAFNKQDSIVEKIHHFSELNDKIGAEIKEFVKKQKAENPILEGEFQEEITYWKNKRAEKEDLIRQIHCIIRIQGKIFKIIQYVKSKGEKGAISIEDLKRQTEGGLKGEWSNQEIIETLEKLVDEEIVPNFLLQQIKDLKDLPTPKKKKNNT